MNEELILQYEEHYEEDKIQFEEKRNFGDPGNMFQPCEHFGALRMKKMKVFTMQQEKITRVFVVTKEKFQWEKKHQHP